MVPGGHGLELVILLHLPMMLLTRAEIVLLSCSVFFFIMVQDPIYNLMTFLYFRGGKLCQPGTIRARHGKGRPKHGLKIPGRADALR